MVLPVQPELLAGARVHGQPRVLAAVLLAAQVLGAPGSGSAYEVVTVADGGIVTGTLKFVGTPPRLDPIPVNKNRDVCGESKPSEALVLGPGHGVKDGVVTLEGVARGKKGSGDVILDNHKCLFVAHVTAVSPGERVHVKNSDPVLHNTHGFMGRPTVFNVALPNKDQLIDVTRRLSRPGVVHVLCDAHTHMAAWILVHDSPYVAVTDARGVFRITDVPPGTYRVTVWHAGFRPKGVDKDGRPVYDEPQTVRKEVTLAPRAMATVDFELR